MAVKMPAMFRLLRTSWRTYRAAPGRGVLMIGGIAVGVALIAALDIINVSVVSNFRTMLERAAGKAALQVELGTGEIGFDEAIVDRVTADSDIEHAFGMVRGTLHASDGSGEVLSLFGVDLVSDAIDSYDVRVVGDRDALELLNDPDSVLLAEEYAARQNLDVDSRVRFATPTGVRELHVRGLLKATGLATVFGGNLAIMDLPAAQRLLGKAERVDQIDLMLKPNAAVEPVQHRLAAALPTSLSVNRPATRGERFERAIHAFQAMLDALGVLCLLAGVFIVYNTTATAITERARDLATILLLGAAPRRIFALVFAEAIVIGAAASAIGILLGMGLAYALTNLVAQSFGTIYQLRFPVESLRLTPAQVAWYLTLGTGGAIAAAIGPAWKASRLDPVELMRPNYRERLSLGPSNGRLLVVGIFVVLTSLVALYLEETRRSILWGNAAVTLWWLATAVLSIPAMSGIVAVCRRVLPRWFGVTGRTAAAGLRRAPFRTGITVGVIAVTLTLAVMLASVASSFQESFRSWFILVGDLVVSAVGTEGGWLESPLSADVGEIIGDVPDVAHVETYRALQGQDFRGARIAVVAVSPGFIDTAPFRNSIVAGDAEAAVQAIRANRDVVVSDSLADRFGLRPGDEITVLAPAGPTPLRISAVVTADFSGDRGSIIMHRDRFATRWSGDTQVSHFNVFLTPGARVETARSAIVQALGDQYRVKVLTLPRTLAYHQGMIDRAFAFTHAIQLLVIIVTLAGIADLLTTQIIERRREIGTLRLVGTPESMVAQAIWLEALIIGLSGALVGLVISFGTSLIWVRVHFRILLGYIVEHHFATLTAVWCVLLAAGVALLAGRLAARRALREPALEALRYE